MTAEKNTIKATIHAPIEKVWEYWTEPQHIVKWNQASEDWHAPFAENDLRPGGTFVTRMEAKDASVGFDFGGTYDEVEIHQTIAYTMGDGRKVDIHFENNGGQTEVMQTFDAESEKPIEAQREGWHAILNNFKKYAEERAS